jgi:lipopolysaccharide biosynthesis glycosyltransferase
MWFGSSDKRALVTVTTASFVPGTLVMLHSFKKHNPWFRGDLIIIHDDSLSSEDVALTESLFKVKWVSADPRLLEKTQALCTHFPDYSRRLGQFYSLEAFRLKGYQKVLFMDSDTLFRASISSLFEENALLLVCRKSGKYKNPEPFDPNKPFSVEQFNAGFMLIDKSLLGDHVYEAMLDKVTPSFFYQFLEKNQAGDWVIPPRFGTDQLIFNAQLQDKATYVSMRYNYRLGIASTILEKEKIGYDDAVIVHFTGRKKPWLLMEALHRIFLHPAEKAAYIEWNEAYLDMIQLIKCHNQ